MFRQGHTFCLRFKLQLPLAPNKYLRWLGLCKPYHLCTLSTKPHRYSSFYTFPLTSLAVTLFDWRLNLQTCMISIALLYILKLVGYFVAGWYNSVNNQHVHDLLSQQNNRFFLFFLSLWIYLWLAETNQQPISQTTWLKVTPHCNHWYNSAAIRLPTSPYFNIEDIHHQTAKQFRRQQQLPLQICKLAWNPSKHPSKSKSQAHTFGKEATQVRMFELLPSSIVHT
jgi:hypothetical protein